MIQCLGAHAHGLPKKLRKAIRRSAGSDRAFLRVEKLILADPAMRALVGTTQAIDLISGGVKSNALPERATALVNHRIAVSPSIPRLFVWMALF